MNRATLTLLTSAGSLAIMVLVANPASAASVADRAMNPAISKPTVPIVNLNRANPTFNAIAQQSNPILDHLGCNCATCTKASTQM